MFEIVLLEASIVLLVKVTVSLANELVYDSKLSALASKAESAVSSAPVAAANSDWSTKSPLTEPVNADSWSNLESCPLFVVSFDAVYEFKEAFNTSSSKYALSIAVPFHTPVAIVPKCSYGRCSCESSLISRF